MAWGMISYEVPLEKSGETYNRQPLCYLGLAAQNNYYALYMMGADASPQQQRALEEGFKKAGKRLDMGKSCSRFKKIDDLPLDVIGELVASTPLKEFISIYETARKHQKL